MQELKILVVADPPSNAKQLRAWFEEAGYTVVDAFSGPQGLQAFLQYRPSFVIIDLASGRRDSFDLLTHIREFSQAPIILLSGKTPQCDKVKGLELGADDYLVKPVGKMELLARVQAIMRRAGKWSTDEETLYTDCAITIDFARHAVYVEGKEVSLTPLEYGLLTCLVNHTGHVVTPRKILDEVWGPEYEEYEYVKWHIGRLRRKIGEDPENPKLLFTIRGTGYRYDPQGSSRTGSTSTTAGPRTTHAAVVAA